MPAPLLSTKYHLPPVAQVPVQRSRLLARLDELLLPGKRLALVSSLAGSGKTTLVRSWVEQMLDPGSLAHTPPVRVAWLSLDEEDNDPAVFLAYLEAGLKTACPEIAIEPIKAFEPGPPGATPLLRPILARVINQLAELPGQVILVLDDYHALSVMAIHEIVAFLLEHQPDCVRVVIVTRAEALLPVSRMRARGQLVEIREADLRFTPAELAFFLNGMMGLNLNPTENELLVERTEGWAAGLQMAALALKALPQPSTQTGEFVRNFSSSHRFVLDYLMDEVFLRLPAPTQSFLLRTAILDRFCADLCRAVLGEIATGGSTSESMGREISTLSHSHLFIIPLDEERCWYRYHHLFAELLRNRLRQEATPGEIAGFQRRAGNWFAERGLISEAVHYMLLAGDFEQAANLIETCAQEVISSGRLTLLNQWLAALPPVIFSSRPRLRIFQALSSFLKGDAAAAIKLSEATGHVLEGLPETGGTLALKRELISILAMSNMTGGDIQRVLPLVQDALDGMPETDLIPRARLLFAQGMAYAMASDKRYYALIHQALELARKGGDPYLAANILNLQAMGAVFFQAEYHAAWQLYTDIIQLCSPAVGEALPLPASLGYIGQAAIALEWNDLDRAASLLEKGAELCRKGGQLSPNFSTLLVRARLKQAQGDLQAAGEELEEAASKRSFDDNIAAVAQLAAAQVRLHLACGRLDLAEHCAAGKALPPSSQPGPEPPALVQEVWGVLQARMQLAHERPVDALKVLDPIVAQAKSAGRKARVVPGQPVSGTGAVCAQARRARTPRHGPGVQPITRCDPPVPRIRVILRYLLVAYRPRLGELSGEADRLLFLLGEPAGRSTALPAEMVESLTAREMDVLRLLCEGSIQPRDFHDPFPQFERSQEIYGQPVQQTGCHQPRPGHCKSSRSPVGLTRSLARFSLADCILSATPF